MTITRSDAIALAAVVIALAAALIAISQAVSASRSAAAAEAQIQLMASQIELAEKNRQQDIRVNESHRRKQLCDQLGIAMEPINSFVVEEGAEIERGKFRLPLSSNLNRTQRLQNFLLNKQGDLDEATKDSVTDLLEKSLSVLSTIDQDDATAFRRELSAYTNAFRSAQETCSAYVGAALQVEQEWDQ